MTRFYLAAPFAVRAAARVLAEQLEGRGFICTSRWLTADDALSEKWALRDLADIQRSDLCVVLNPDAWTQAGTGGRHVELGYALGLRKPIVLVGPRTNIFHYLADAICAPDVSDILAALHGLAHRHEFPIDPRPPRLEKAAIES